MTPLLAVLLLAEPVALRVQPAEPLLRPDATLDALAAAPFAILRGELSPAVIVQCAGSELRLFGRLGAWGLRAPQRLTHAGAEGVATLGPGRGAPTLTEPWLLAWFAGDHGSVGGDVPVLMVLQHRPTALELGDDGLRLEFAGPAGLTAVMPLAGLTAVDTAGWREPPAEVIDRCRRWARWLRRIPVDLHERFHLDGDEVVIQWHADWLAIDDDWATPAERLLPLSPVLALAWWAGEHGAENPFPMTLDVRLTDSGLTTPYGPYVGAVGTDAMEVRLATQRYIREEPVPTSQPAAGPVAEVQRWLAATLAGKFADDSWARIWDHGGPENYCWQAMGDRWYGRALPYLPDDVRARVAAALVGYLDEWVLREELYTPFRGMLLLKGPGIGTWGGYDDAGKFSSNLLETIESIAATTGCWDLIRERWDLIRRLDITPLECDWKAFGRYSIAELGDEAGPPRALARLAWRVGDHDTYALASLVFARELVHHYVKQVGAPYFRGRLPVPPGDPMPDEVYLTNLWGDVAGWRIDGPTWPRDHGERQYTNRWVRFSSRAVGRFYQEVLPRSVAAELALLADRADFDQNKFKPDVDTAHIQPSLVRLRALLLGESAADLLARQPLDTWRVGRAGDRAAMAVPVLENAAPADWRADIPPARGEPVVGLTRLRATAESSSLVLTVDLAGADAPATWRGTPWLRWFDSRSPMAPAGLPRGERLSFGTIGPTTGPPRTDWISPSTQLTRFAD